MERPELLPDDVYVAGLNRKRTAAGMLFRHEDGRVLLVETSYKDDWELPGGTGEADESPWETARREVREEIGLDQAPGRLLLIEYLPTVGVFDEALIFLFDGGPVTDDDVAALVVDGFEIVRAVLCTPAEVAARAPQRAPRIAAALAAALTSAPTVLFQAGRPLA